MKEKEYYRTAVKVSAVVSYVDVNHKEKGIQERAFEMLSPDLNEDDVKHLFDDVLEPNERFIDYENLVYTTVKVWFKLSDLVKIGRVEEVKLGD